MNGNSHPLIRAIRGPVTLITVGVLFALNNFTQYGFDQTWPVLLIVFGLLSLMRRGTATIRRRPSTPAMPPPPPYSYPPPGGYARESVCADRGAGNQRRTGVHRNAGRSRRTRPGGSV